MRRGHAIPVLQRRPIRLRDENQPSPAGLCHPHPPARGERATSSTRHPSSHRRVHFRECTSVRVPKDSRVYTRLFGVGPGVRPQRDSIGQNGLRIGGTQARARSRTPLCCLPSGSRVAFGLTDEAKGVQRVDSGREARVGNRVDDDFFEFLRGHPDVECRSEMDAELWFATC